MLRWWLWTFLSLLIFLLLFFSGPNLWISWIFMALLLSLIDYNFITTKKYKPEYLTENNRYDVYIYDMNNGYINQVAFSCRTSAWIYQNISITLFIFLRITSIFSLWMLDFQFRRSGFFWSVYSFPLRIIA